MLSNIVSGIKDDRPAMQYSYLSSIPFAANPVTALPSSLINSIKSYAYDSASEEQQRVLDWATSTRGFTDTVTMPPG